MLTIIQCHKLIASMRNMDQFYHINDAIDDLYLTITIMNVIDTISHQIGIPIAIYVVLAGMIYCRSWYDTNTLNLFLFYLTTNKIDNADPIISTINSVITIMVHTDGIYIILVTIDTVNVILIRGLDTNIHKGRIIWFVLNRNEIIVIIIIHHDTFDTTICKMIMYYHVIINIINKSCIIINAIDAIVQNKFYGINCIKLNLMVLIVLVIVFVMFFIQMQISLYNVHAILRKECQQAQYSYFMQIIELPNNGLMHNNMIGAANNNQELNHVGFQFDLAMNGNYNYDYNYNYNYNDVDYSQTIKQILDSIRLSMINSVNHWLNQCVFYALILFGILSGYMTQILFEAQFLHAIIFWAIVSLFGQLCLLPLLLFCYHNSTQESEWLKFENTTNNQNKKNISNSSNRRNNRRDGKSNNRKSSKKRSRKQNCKHNHRSQANNNYLDERSNKYGGATVEYGGITVDHLFHIQNQIKHW